MEVNYPPPPLPAAGNSPINIHASEWTDERIEHAYANSISQIPDISTQNTMGVRGKRIQLLGLF